MFQREADGGRTAHREADEMDFGETEMVDKGDDIGDAVGATVAALRSVGESVAAGVLDDESEVVREKRNLVAPHPSVKSEAMKENDGLTGAVFFVVGADGAVSDVRHSLVKLFQQASDLK